MVLAVEPQEAAGTFDDRLHVYRSFPDLMDIDQNVPDMIHAQVDLSVPTVEFLKKRGFELIQIDVSERQTMACNVFAMGPNNLLALEENAKTNQRLRDKGFVVATFSGSELCQNGSGGPTCLTRPLWRG